MKGKFCRLRFALFAAVLPALSHGGGAKLAPGDIDAADLTPLKTPNRASGAPVKWIEDGKALLPIVCAYDFAERVLGVRQYFAADKGGRSVTKTEGLAMPQLDYADEPVFAMRSLWPCDESEWASVWKTGDNHPVLLHVHRPSNWHSDTNFNYKTTKPWPLEKTEDGQRGVSAELCYGNPALGATGDASPTIRFFFHPGAVEADEEEEWKIVTLPCINTCDLPSPDFRYEETNVEAMLCTMPGLAMLKNEAVREHEENLIVAWRRATGNKVQNWRCICWPADFTCAPYLFGEVIKGHCRRMREHIHGSFIKGGCPLERLIVSAYMWARCLWNPEVYIVTAYDVFRKRMFGAAAGTMRELLRMQEAGWNRQWRSSEVSNKNAHETSYPRREVLHTEELSAAGRFWSGNFCRYRAPRPGERESRKGIGSFSRLYTRGSDWNKDSPAFGELQFME